MASSPYELDGHRPLPEPEYDPYNTSFTTKRINKTTFLIVEDDEFEEHPFIYVKVHPKLPIIILSDTGCAQPKRKIGKDGECRLTLLSLRPNLPSLQAQPFVEI